MCYRKFKPVSPLGTAPVNGAMVGRVTKEEILREGLHKMKHMKYAVATVALLAGMATAAQAGLDAG